MLTLESRLDSHSWISASPPCQLVPATSPSVPRSNNDLGRNETLMRRNVGNDKGAQVWVLRQFPRRGEWNQPVLRRHTAAPAAEEAHHAISRPESGPGSGDPGNGGNALYG